MKRQFYILFSIIVMAIPEGLCQSSENIRVDTLSCVELIDDGGVNYKIIQTVDLRDNHWVDSTRKLVIYYDTKKATIHLPISDEEVKNFSVEEITRNHNGIIVNTTQGGGTCIVRRHFILNVIHHQLFLVRIISEYGSFDSEEIETEVQPIQPHLPIDETELTPFLL